MVNAVVTCKMDHRPLTIAVFTLFFSLKALLCLNLSNENKYLNVLKTNVKDGQIKDKNKTNYVKSNHVSNDENYIFNQNLGFRTNRLPWRPSYSDYETGNNGFYNGFYDFEYTGSDQSSMNMQHSTRDNNYYYGVDGEKQKLTSSTESYGDLLGLTGKFLYIFSEKRKMKMKRN